MARVKGNVQLGLNIEPTGQSILDARLWVATLEELYSAYPEKNFYQDMVVTVGDQKAQYMLIDTEKVTEAAGWKRIDAGGAEVIEIVNDLTTGGANKALSAEMGKKLATDLNSMTVVKLETPEEGMAASYQLQKNGVAVGATINVLKDQFVQSGSVVKVGGKLVIRLVVNGTDVDVPADQLVDKYTGSTYITVEGANVVSLNYDALKTQLDTDLGVSALKTKVGSVEEKATTLETTVAENTKNISTNTQSISRIDGELDALTNPDQPNSLAAKIGALETTVGDAESGLVKDVADLKVSVGKIKVKDVDSTSSNGVSLSLAEGVVKVTADVTALTGQMNAGQIKVGKVITGHSEESTSVADALSSIAASVESAVSGGITGISSPDNTITVGGTTNAKTLAVNVQNIIAADSAIAVNNGKLDLQWIEA